MQRMLRSGTPARFRRRKSGGIRRSAGVRRVLSSLTIRTRSEAFTSSSIGGWPIGAASAASMAASRSATGVDRLGTRTWARFFPGTSKLRGLPPKGIVTVVISPAGAR